MKIQLDDVIHEILHLQLQNPCMANQFSLMISLTKYCLICTFELLWIDDLRQKAKSSRAMQMVL